MTNREKILAGGMGAVLGLYGGYWGIKSLVYQPYVDKKLAIQAEKDRNALLTTDANRRIALLQNWQLQTSRTLAANEEKAIQVFREDVQRLLSAHGLTADENLAVTPRSRPIRSKVLNEDCTELTLNIEVRGELGQMVDFLRDMYRRPYLLSVDKLTMSPESGGPNPSASANKPSNRPRSASGSRKPGPSLSAGKPNGAPGAASSSAPAEPTALALSPSPSGGPRMKFSLSISTLVLPENHDAPHNVLSPTDIETKVSDLLSNDLDYTEIAAVNPFKVWEPEKATPVAEGPKEATTQTSQPPKPPPPLPKSKETLIATLSLDGVPLAYVRNEDRKQEAPRELKLNDELDGGHIVLIHPYGMVVRMKAGSATAGKEFFYPLGALLSEKKEVSSVKGDEYPGVLEELALVRRSQSSGNPPAHQAGIE